MTQLWNNFRESDMELTLLPNWINIRLSANFMCFKVSLGLGMRKHWVIYCAIHCLYKAYRLKPRTHTYISLAIWRHSLFLLVTLSVQHTLFKSLAVSYVCGGSLQMMSWTSLNGWQAQELEHHLGQTGLGETFNAEHVHYCFRKHLMDGHENAMIVLHLSYHK